MRKTGRLLTHDHRFPKKSPFPWALPATGGLETVTEHELPGS